MYQKDTSQNCQRCIFPDKSDGRVDGNSSNRENNFFSVVSSKNVSNDFHELHIL